MLKTFWVNFTPWVVQTGLNALYNTCRTSSDHTTFIVRIFRIVQNCTDFQNFNLKNYIFFCVRIFKISHLKFILNLLPTKLNSVDGYLIQSTAKFYLHLNQQRFCFWPFSAYIHSFLDLIQIKTNKVWKSCL